MSLKRHIALCLPVSKFRIIFLTKLCEWLQWKASGEFWGQRVGWHILFCDIKYYLKLCGLKPSTFIMLQFLWVRNGRADQLAFLVQGLSWSFNHMSDWAALTWRLDWGWRICSQDDSITWLANSCRLLAGLLMWVSPWLLEYPHNMAASFARWSQRVKTEVQFSSV